MRSNQVIFEDEEMISQSLDDAARAGSRLADQDVRNKRFCQMDTKGTAPHDATSQDELTRLDRYWRAANYLSVGQIYLLDNPLLKEPLRPEHIKPRLLGHWGTTPGLNFIYAHLNRI